MVRLFVQRQGAVAAEFHEKRIKSLPGVGYPSKVRRREQAGYVGGSFALPAASRTMADNSPLPYPPGIRDRHRT